MATVFDGEFEWDEAKATSNVTRHGVTFEEALTALADPLAVEVGDVSHPSRVLTTGMSGHSRVLLVVSTERGAHTRIISARRATARERRNYVKGI